MPSKCSSGPRERGSDPRAPRPEMALSRLIVRIASWLVPARERSEWRLEWESEIWHYRRELASEDRLDWRMEMKLLGRSLGAVADALHLRGSPRGRGGLGG